MRSVSCKTCICMRGLSCNWAGLKLAARARWPRPLHVATGPWLTAAARGPPPQQRGNIAPFTACCVLAAHLLLRLCAAAYGPHAAAVAARLHAGGLSCKVLDRPAFTCAMLEKLVWIRYGDNALPSPQVCGTGCCPSTLHPF
jgi:hypothetical protein